MYTVKPILNVCLYLGDFMWSLNTVLLKYLKTRLSAMTTYQVELTLSTVSKLRLILGCIWIEIDSTQI